MIVGEDGDDGNGDSGQNGNDGTNGMYVCVRTVWCMCVGCNTSGHCGVSCMLWYHKEQEDEEESCVNRNN